MSFIFNDENETEEYLLVTPKMTEENISLCCFDYHHSTYLCAWCGKRCLNLTGGEYHFCKRCAKKYKPHEHCDFCNAVGTKRLVYYIRYDDKKPEIERCCDSCYESQLNDIQMFHGRLMNTLQTCRKCNRLILIDDGYVLNFIKELTCLRCAKNELL